MSNTKRLYRSRENRVIFGFCGGIGDYFDIDPVIIRIIYVVLMLGTAAGLILIILYFLTPLFVPLGPRES